VDIASRSITVVGTGSWGTTLAISLARAGRRTTLLARSPEEAAALRAAGQHERFAPGVPFPLSLAIEGDPEAALRDCRVLLMAVPSQTMRANSAALKPYLPPDAIVLSCAKGFEQGSLKRMSQVLADELPDHVEQIGALSGPNIAREILDSKPATTVVATQDHAMAEIAQRFLTTSYFRVYSGDDVVGIELAGALKNIIALGAGLADGLNAGDNAKAAFLTRGLAEIARLGIVLGASPLTFAGLAGLGDLVATCASPHSRNRRMGEALARGLTLEAARAQLGGIAEGVITVQTARELAAQHQVELPIADQLYRVLFAGKSPQHAIVELMQREVKHELDGMRGLLGL
jgi:glycerol-3-phosphate dehydrogenase (NAD(P)+)